MRHGSILLVIPGEISSNPEKKIKSKKYVYTQLQDVLCLYFRVNKLERNMSLTYVFIAYDFFKESFIILSQ